MTAIREEFVLMIEDKLRELKMLKIEAILAKNKVKFINYLVRSEWKREDMNKRSWFVDEKAKTINYGVKNKRTGKATGLGVRIVPTKGYIVVAKFDNYDGSTPMRQRFVEINMKKMSIFNNN